MTDPDHPPETVLVRPLASSQMWRYHDPDPDDPARPACHFGDDEPEGGSWKDRDRAELEASDDRWERCAFCADTVNIYRGGTGDVAARLADPDFGPEQLGLPAIGERATGGGDS